MFIKVRDYWLKHSAFEFVNNFLLRHNRINSIPISIEILVGFCSVACRCRVACKRAKHLPLFLIYLHKINYFTHLRDLGSAVCRYHTKIHSMLEKISDNSTIVSYDIIDFPSIASKKNEDGLLFSSPFTSPFHCTQQNTTR